MSTLTPVLTLMLALLSPIRLAQTKVTTPSTVAPLPDKIVAAKTVFLVNDTGTAKFGDALYAQLRAWGRWEVVTDRSKANLVLMLSQRDIVDGMISTGTATTNGQTASGTAVGAPIKSSSWYLYVLDASTGERLWTSNTSMGGKLWRSWGSVAKSLLADLQKRF